MARREHGWSVAAVPNVDYVLPVHAIYTWLEHMNAAKHLHTQTCAHISSALPRLPASLLTVLPDPPALPLLLPPENVTSPSHHILPTVLVLSLLLLIIALLAWYFLR